MGCGLKAGRRSEVREGGVHLERKRRWRAALQDLAE